MASAQEWLERQAGGTSLDLHAAVHDGTAFVAVGDQGRILRSTDAGQTWVQRLSRTTSILNDAARGGGLTVVVGQRGSIVTSANGTNWTEQTSPLAADWRSVAYTGSAWITVGAHGSIQTSNNGSSWQPRYVTGFQENLQAVAATSSLAIAVGESGSILTSTDQGATWSVVTISGASESFTGIAYNGSTWLLASMSGDTWTSSNGSTWTAGGDDIGFGVYSLEWNGSAFIVTGPAGRVEKSTNGTSWTSANIIATANILGTATGGGTTLAVGSAGFTASSPGVNTWTPHVSGLRSNFNAVAASSSLTVAVGNAGKITSSADGISWTERSSGTSNDLHGLVWTGSSFIAVGRDDSVYRSADAVAWSPVDTSAGESLNSIAVNADTIIAVGNNGTVLKSVDDGLNWTGPSTSTGERLLAVAHGAGVWVAVGTRGTILSSSNEGSTWTQRTSGLGLQDLSCVAYGPEGFRVVSSLGVILGSTTGTTWTQVGNFPQSQGDLRMSQIVWAAGQWVAVGVECDADADHSGVLYMSADASSFQRVSINTALPLKGFTMAAGMPCLVGEQGFIGTVTRSILWQVNSVTQLESGPAINLTAVLSSSVNADLTIPISWSGAARVGGSGDVRSVPASITIPANATTASITLQLRDDPLDEPNENLLLSLNPVLSPRAVAAVTPAALFTLNLIDDDEPPSITPPPSLSNFAIGQNVNVALSASGTPTQWMVAGLPPGLRVSTSGVITGRILAPGTYTLRIIALNATGTSAPVEVTWQVQALDSGLLGNYSGVIQRVGQLNSDLGGRLQLTFSATGGYTGLIQLGTQSHPFTGQAQILSASTAQIQQSLPNGLTLNLDLDGSSGLGDGSLMNGMTATLFNLVHAVVAPATSYAGTYTLGMKLDTAQAGNVAVPQGHGYGTLTISSSGMSTGYLYLADHTGVPVSTQLRAGGSLTVYAPLYAGTGSLLGELQVTSATSTLSSSGLSWSKFAQPTASLTRSYKQGWVTPLSLTATGAKYTAPAAGQTILNLSPVVTASSNLSVKFTEGGVPDPTTRLDTDFRIIAPAVLDPSVPLAVNNPGKVTLSIQAATGLFSGSFTLTDVDATIIPNVPLTRVAYFYGALTQDSDTTPVGLGHFNLAQMPIAGPPRVTATPILSGTVLLEEP